MPIPYGPENVERLTKEWERLKRQKYRQSGGVESRILLALAHYYGEQTVYYRAGTLILPGSTVPTDSKSQPPPSLVFNFIRRNYRRMAGRFSATELQFKGKPESMDSEDIANAVVFDKMIRAVQYEINDATLAEQRLFWAYCGGVCAVHTTYMPNQEMEPMPVVDPLTGSPMYQHVETDETMPQAEMEQLTTAPLDPLTGQPMTDPQTGEPVAAKYPKEAFKIYQEPQLTGAIVEEVVSPLHLFVDNRCRGFENLGPDECVEIANLQTIDWVKNNFPDAEGLDNLRPAEDVRIITSTIEQAGDSLSGWALKDLIPGLTGTIDEDDPPSVVVIFRYQPASMFLPKGWYSDNYPEYQYDEDFDNGGRFTVFVPEQMIVRDGEIPYKDGVPMQDIHWESIKTTFWNQGAIEDQIPPQQSYNRRRNQSIEATNIGQDRILLGAGMSKDDFYIDDPSSPIENAWSEDGKPLIGRLGAATWPAWARQVMEEDKELMFVFGGSADITTQAGYPGDLRGNAWLPMAQELLDSEHGPFMKRYARVMERVITMRANRVKQFYPEQRTMRYTTSSGRDEVFEFMKSEVLRCDWNVAVVPSSLQPEFREMREFKMRDRLQSGIADIMYKDPDTGVFDRTRFISDMLYDQAEDLESRISRHVKLQHDELMHLRQAHGMEAYSMDDHAVHIEVLEGFMTTLEYRMDTSPEVMKVTQEHYDQHAQFLTDEAEAAMQQEQAEVMTAEMSSLIATAVNNSVTQALADQDSVQSSIAREALTGEPEPAETGGQMPAMPGMNSEPM